MQGRQSEGRGRQGQREKGRIERGRRGGGELISSQAGQCAGSVRAGLAAY